MQIIALVCAIGLLLLVAARYFPEPYNWLAGIAHACLLFGRVLPKRLLAPMLAIFGSAFAFYFHSWALIAWVCFLAGIEISRTMASVGPLHRTAGILLVFFLLALLFFVLLPQTLLSGLDVQTVFNNVVQIIFICWSIGILSTIFEPADDSKAEPIFSSLFVLIFTVLAMTVALISFQFPHYEYTWVVLTVVGAGCCVGLSVWFLWNTNLLGGLSMVFFRHVLSLGIPADEWIKVMTETADIAVDGEQFWDQAMIQLLQMTDLNGISWQQHGQEKLVGIRGKHMSIVQLPGQNLGLHTSRYLLPSKSFSFWLLARVAHEFRQSKEREARLATELKLRSIHEHGARTTHDLKNLLHAITLICSSFKSDNQTEIILSRKKRDQLQLLAGRLETTLARLTGDNNVEASGGMMTSGDWWQSAQRRNVSDFITFNLSKNADLTSKVPADLFDRALENLLHNALRKQDKDQQLRIIVSLESGPTLSVEDNGTSIPATIMSKLFSAPLSSSEGMGIGLYQLASNADKKGYRLFVRTNESGCVCLSLTALPNSSQSTSDKQ